MVVRNSLQTYRCEKCQRNYMAKTVFDMYIANKDMDKMDVNFEMVDREYCLSDYVE